MKLERKTDLSSEGTMAITLNLPPVVEQQLKEKAVRSGQTLEEFLQQLAVSEAEKSELTNSYPSKFASKEEWVKAFR